VSNHRQHQGYFMDTKQLVVKDNMLINASYNLDLIEQRMILLAVVGARETGQGITADSRLIIHAQNYMDCFNTNRSGAYEALKTAAKNLFERKFTYKEIREGKEFYIKSRWVSEVGYCEEQGCVTLAFAPVVVPLITRNHKHFTWYKLGQIAELKSKYAVRLYEILIAWREVGKTPTIQLSDLRFSLGIEETEYQRIPDFKARVLNPALKQINAHTDIEVECDQIKTGRVVSGFNFKLKMKPTVEKVSKKATEESEENKLNRKILTMTDSQITTFATKLSRLHSFGGKYGGQNEQYEQLAMRTIDMLVDPKTRMELKDYLVEAGFK